jgi:hypothetical protein
MLLDMFWFVDLLLFLWSWCFYSQQNMALAAGLVS